MSDHLVAREDAFDFCGPEYADLYRRSEATLFQHPVWLDQTYRSLAPAAGAEPVVVTVREPTSGRLLMLVPLVRRRRRGVRILELADLGVSDYTTVVVDRDATTALLADPGLPERLHGTLGGFDLLLLQKLRGSTTPTSRLLGGQDIRRLPYDAHPIALPPASEPWRDKLLDPSFARHLARKRKRLRPKGDYAVVEVTDPAAVDDVLERLRGFRAARFADRRATDLVQDPACFAFYSAVARRSLAEGGPVRLVVVVVGDAPVAATLDLEDDQQHLFVVVGYDFARLRNYSLGLLIVEDLVDRAVDAGLHTFDLTVGNEGYKSDFGASPVPMYAARVAATARGRLAGRAMDLEADARRTARWVRAAREQAHARRSAPPQN